MMRAAWIFFGGLLVAALVLPVRAEDDDDDDEDNAAPAIPVYNRYDNSSSRNSSRHVNPARIRMIEIQREQERFSWDADESLWITRIEIFIGEQKIRVYQGARKVAVGRVSTGRVGYTTPPGSYTVVGKEIAHVSNLYGDFVNERGTIVDYNAHPGQTPPPGCHYTPSPMPFFLRLNLEGVGLHAGFLPGHPDSHGCIRLPRALAERLYYLVNVDTPVTIYP
jgi:lipoprotein-anchoring transpeptidase ErfK/SrfK